jgi:pimeloyl-ACP methyl ester carboxylesterase
MKVFFLHGLRDILGALRVAENNVKKLGFKTFRPSYKTVKYRLSDMIKNVSCIMQKDADKSEPIAIVGHSLGGLIARGMHQDGWTNIKIIITIATPHKKVWIAGIADTIFSKIPFLPRKYLVGPVFEDFINLDLPTKLPHPAICITGSWPGTNFDGRVRKENMTFEGATKTYDVGFTDHLLIAFHSKTLDIINRELIYFAKTASNPPHLRVSEPSSYNQFPNRVCHPSSTISNQLPQKQRRLASP